jgi:hypothetical protein
MGQEDVVAGIVDTLADFEASQPRKALDHVVVLDPIDPEERSAVRLRNG